MTFCKEVSLSSRSSTRSILDCLQKLAEARNGVAFCCVVSRNMGFAA